MRATLTFALLVACADGRDDPADTDPVDTDPADTDTIDTDPVDTDGPGACRSSTTAPPARPAATFDGSGATVVDLGVAVTRCLITEDLDGDGAIDVAWIPDEASELHVRWSGLRPDATTVTIPIPAPAERSWGGCAALDVGGDGAMDVVHVHSDGVSVVRFDGRAPTLDDTVLARVGDPWVAPAVLPIDADGVPPVDLLLTSIGGLGDGCDWDIAGAPFDASQFVPGQMFCAIGAPDGTYTLDDGSLCPPGLRDLPGPVAHEAVNRDLDADGLRDLLVIVEFGPPRLARGRAGGGFEAPIALPGLEDDPGALGGDAVDLDFDGRLDLLFGEVDGWTARPGAACLAFDPPGPAGAKDRFVWSPRAVDLDRNGRLDVVGASSVARAPGRTTLPPCEAESWLIGEGPLLAVSLADGAGFTTTGVEVVPEGESPFLDGRVAVADLDGDGAPELAIAGPKGARLIDPNLAPVGSWLRVRPLSTQGAPLSDPARVRVHGEGVDLHLEVDAVHGSERTADFGLGGAAGPVTVEVTWSDGASTVLTDVALDQQLTIPHPDTP